MKVLISSAVALCIGVSGGIAAPAIISKAKSARDQWDNTVAKEWPAEFVVQTTSKGQKLFAHAPKELGKRPLVISLHTWSGSYDQHDQLAPYAAANGWNYVHPQVQGPNNHPGACLSDAVLADIEDAYDWAIGNMDVDVSNVVVVGVSGGAYTALGSMLKSKIPAKAYFAWVPITDLAAWRNQSAKRNQKYLADIEACAAVAGAYSLDEARRRSPMNIPLVEGRKYPQLHLFAGLHDGFNGSVPTSHSILFYNRLAKHYGASESDLVNAEQMAAITTLASEVESEDLIGDRDIHLRRTVPGVSLTVFDGGHEMLVAYTAETIARTISN
ncbi:alpha/beta hydrolase family protein [Stenotrophomonas sp. PSU-St15]